MPWADWKDREVRFLWGWWVRVSSPEGKKDLLPDTYRLVLMGANMELMRTEAFTWP